MMAISKCNNSSAFGPVRILWRHLKLIFKDNKCLENIINIANTYINLGHWLSHFKVSLSIIIPKLNKVTYNSPKSFYPIILLNTLGKLIEKVIGRCLQFYSSKSTWRTQTMFHNRCRSCLNAFNLIWIGQESSDMLAFDIAQFFPSLNYQLIPLILKKAGFDSRISCFFSDYLVDRLTKYS